MIGKTQCKIIKKKSLAINLVLLFVSILFLLIFAEITIRIIGAVNDIDYRLYMKELKNSDRLPEGLFYFDSDLMKLRPNTQVLATTSDFSVIYKTNKHGLRDKEYDYVKPPDKIRILAFGDSVTFGEGVEYGDRFTDIPENQNSEIEIINFGVPGYGLDQELLLFASEGLKYSADYVIIFINMVDVKRYSTNIIQNDSIINKNTLQETPNNNSDTLYFKRDDPFFNENRNVIFQNSYFLNYLNYKVQLLLLKNHLENYDKDLWENIYNNIQAHYSLLTDLNDESYIKKRAALILNKFYEISKKEDIKLIIIKIDSYGELDYIKDINENIYYYDLTQALKNESKKYDLSFKYDPHYNKRTHEFIGNKLKQILSYT